MEQGIDVLEDEIGIDIQTDFSEKDEVGVDSQPDFLKGDKRRQRRTFHL